MEDYTPGMIDSYPTKLDDIKAIHEKFTLYGIKRNEILNVSDELLNYVISILQNEPVEAPDVPLEQWYSFLSLLDEQRITPFIYWKLKEMPSLYLPSKTIMDNIRLKYMNSAAISLQVEGQLKYILHRFESEGIDVLVLKGPGLAYGVYPQTASRSYNDIDLLIKPEDMPRSRVAMEGLGYDCLKKRYDISRDWYYEEQFLHKNDLKCRPVEIHWDLHPYSILGKMDFKQLYDRSDLIDSKDMKFRTLNTVDALIYSALHMGFIHCREVKLSWILDVDLLCKRLKEDDWIKLQKRSVETCARMALENSLIMTTKWTGLKIPSHFDDFSKWPEPTKNEVLAYSYVLQDSKRTFRSMKLKWPASFSMAKKAHILLNVGMDYIYDRIRK
ncbi:hypothetical protein CUJ83_07830 [Methanocella sp. CWC-04]|uniref:Nucleotidyltransferase n=1 Tax=Methanooceanicella nereidis TaxID=2052831 RepID=A0AAP2RE73_9EURY|nr:nucleotidyltransferase family protein [Methanocella sp. CWC-04]MCD1294905.1 hypothetical protein [Methanocella sp. CWC-04]